MLRCLVLCLKTLVENCRQGNFYAAFLHIPKCAGTSIRELLKLNYANEVIFDDESFFRIPKHKRTHELLNSLNYPKSVNENNFVFGHFFPIKYIYDQNSSELKLVTILRDPLERLKSHYFYWNNGDFSDHYLWRKMQENKWTLSQFIMSDEMRNFYDQYLCQCPLQFFSYIGIYENLIESTRNCLLNIGLSGDFADLPWLNKTSNKLPRELSESFIREAQDFHAQDYLIYNYAIKKFHSDFKPTTPQP